MRVTRYLLKPLAAGVREIRSFALSITSRMFDESESNKIDRYATKLRVFVGMISVLFESHEIPSFSSNSARFWSSSSRQTGWYAGGLSILRWAVELTQRAKSPQLYKTRL